MAYSMVYPSINYISSMLQDLDRSYGKRRKRIRVVKFTLHFGLVTVSGLVTGQGGHLVAFKEIKKIEQERIINGPP